MKFFEIKTLYKTKHAILFKTIFKNIININFFLNKSHRIDTYVFFFKFSYYVINCDEHARE